MASVSSPIDQAAGLRKLLPHGGPRVVTFASIPRAGRTMACANLAVAAAQMGWHALVLDCGGGGAGASWLLRAEAHGDLLDVVNNRLPLKAIAAAACPGVEVVRAQRAASALPRMSAEDETRLVRAVTDLAAQADLVLVDAGRDDLSWAAAAGEVVLVTRPGPEALMQSYQHLKRIHAHAGLGRALVLMNGVESQAHADRIFGNLCATAERFMQLRLELLGLLPEDESVARAVGVCHTVVEAFPQSPAARAARAGAAELMGRVGYGKGGIDLVVRRLAAAARLVGAR